MTDVEIPLLRESTVFATRLVQAARRFGESRYFFHRRVNWSHRYASHFYALEAQRFRESPESYMGSACGEPSELEDVFCLKCDSRQIALVTIKVVAHWFFRMCGSIRPISVPMQDAWTYRKCYVEDIELVFEPEAPAVIRVVYPFPISVARQWRYLATLRRKRRAFELSGNPYLVRDVVRFLVRRDIRSLLKLEVRAQLRQALHVVHRGCRKVELSDEFDIGSLEFSRVLRHRGVRVINSAHGVGKYLPAHAYSTFWTITKRQIEYYREVRKCEYDLRVLNEVSGDGMARVSVDGVAVHAKRRVAFLSQVFKGVSSIVSENEVRVLDALRCAFEGDENVVLFYRPHPNQRDQPGPDGFRLLVDLASVNGAPGTVFLSFFSTCQIDPAFKGEKILLRGELIYPEMAFDDTEKILDIQKAIERIREGIAGKASGVPSKAALTQSAGSHER